MKYIIDEQSIITNINNKVNQLTKLRDNFVGITEQQEIFLILWRDLDKLKDLYPPLFNSGNNNDFQNSISTINDMFFSEKYQSNLITRTTNFPIGTNGLLVMHKTKYYVGIIDLSKMKCNKYCITLLNGWYKYAAENEINIIGFYEKRNIYLEINEQPKIDNIKNKPFPDGCTSCKSRIECVRKSKMNGICNDYERGASSIDHTQLDSKY